MKRYVTGSYGYNAICDVCGFQFKNHQLMKRWDGYMVCKDDWEPRNILDFIKIPSDTHILPWVRPDYVGETVINPAGNFRTLTPLFFAFRRHSNSVAGNMIAGKAIASISFNRERSANIAATAGKLIPGNSVVGVSLTQEEQGKWSRP